MPELHIQLTAGEAAEAIKEVVVVWLRGGLANESQSIHDWFSVIVRVMSDSP